MSEVNPFSVEDYLTVAKSRLTTQFEDKPVINKYLELLISGCAELQQIFKELKQERSLDTAVGAQLDILGNIVGQERILVNVDIFEFFGFLGVPNAGAFGSLDNTSVGAVFWDLNTPRYGNIRLTDDMYRIFIKAKIAKNITSATPEEVMRFANFIFGAPSSTIQYEGTAAYTLMIGKELSSLELSLLTYVDTSSNYNSYLIPKPTGVRVNYGQYDGNRFFAFAGAPNAKGFGQLDSAHYDGEFNYDGGIGFFFPGLKDGVGGKLASLIKAGSV